MDGSPLFCACSLIMASIFAYSASVQLNDHDWYFWFPLYVSASAVNFLQPISKSRPCNQMGKVALVLGTFLFLKVVVEDSVEGAAGLCSLDLSERVVREKIGSGFVVVSMILQLKASEVSRSEKRCEFGRCLDFAKRYSLIGAGMALIVAANLWLCISFLLRVTET